MSWIVETVVQTVVPRNRRPKYSVKDTTTGAITLTVIEEDGSTTTIQILGSGDFNF